MPVAVNQPREKESDLDQILKGLKIAESAYGIYDAGKRREAIEEANKLEKERQGKMDQFAIDKYKQDTDIEIAKNFKDVPQGTPGAILIPDSSGNIRTLLPREKPTELPKFSAQEYTDKDGNVRIGNFDPRTGNVRTSSNDPLAKPNPSATPKFTEGQTKSAMFANRASTAVADMDKLSAEGYDRTGLIEGAQASLLPGFMQSGKTKQQLQAERNFITAVLRDESGASIGKDEYKNAEAVYLPQSGDTPEVLAQKKQARADAIAGLQNAAGPALAGIERIATNNNSQQNITTQQKGSGTAQASEANSAVKNFINKNKSK